MGKGGCKCLIKCQIRELSTVIYFMVILSFAISNQSSCQIQVLPKLRYLSKCFDCTVFCMDLVTCENNNSWFYTVWNISLLIFPAQRILVLVIVPFGLLIRTAKNEDRSIKHVYTTSIALFSSYPHRINFQETLRDMAQILIRFTSYFKYKIIFLSYEAVFLQNIFLLFLVHFMN